MKFYRCNKCGNVITMLNDHGVNPVCCNEAMELLIPQTIDEGKEKHVPLVLLEDNNVVIQIGETIHPIQDNHHIEMIALQTSNGFHVQFIPVGEIPKTTFHLRANEKPIMVYTYCNIHNLWQKEI